VPVQVGGGLRDRSSVAELLDLGVQRVILGTVAVEPQLVAELCQEFPGQIVVGIDPVMDEWQLAVGWKPLRFWQLGWLCRCKSWSGSDYLHRYSP